MPIILLGNYYVLAHFYCINPPSQSCCEMGIIIPSSSVKLRELSRRNSNPDVLAAKPMVFLLLPRPHCTRYAQRSLCPALTFYDHLSLSKHMLMSTGLATSSWRRSQGELGLPEALMAFSHSGSSVYLPHPTPQLLPLEATPLTWLGALRGSGSMKECRTERSQGHKGDEVKKNRWASLGKGRADDHGEF